MAGRRILKEFEKKVTEFTLANGLHSSSSNATRPPVVSFTTYVKRDRSRSETARPDSPTMCEHHAFQRPPGSDQKELAGGEEGGRREGARRRGTIYGPRPGRKKERRKDIAPTPKRETRLEHQLKAASDRPTSTLRPTAYPRICGGETAAASWE